MDARDELLISMARAMGLQSDLPWDICQGLRDKAEALRREGEARSVVDVTMRVVEATDEYGAFERHRRHIYLRYGKQGIHLRFEDSTAGSSVCWSLDGQTWHMVA